MTLTSSIRKKMSAPNAAVYAQYRPCRLVDVVSLFPNGFDLISDEMPHLKPPKNKYVRRPNRLQSARPAQPESSKVKETHFDRLY